MGTTDRKAVRPVRAIKRGDPLTARYFNRLADGVNQSLAALDPPRSLKVRSTDEQLNALTNEPGRQFQEISRTTTTVRIYQDDDPTSDNWVDVERIDVITFRAGADEMTLILDWP